MSDGTDDANTTALTGDVEFAIDQFILGAELENIELDSFSDASLFRFRGYAGYMVTPEVLVGAGLTSGSFDGVIEYDFSGYEVFGQYQNSQLGVALTYAEPDTDIDDLSFVTVSGQAALTAEVTATAFFEQFEDDDDRFYAFAVDYDNGQIAARGWTQGFTESDLSRFGVTGSYGVTSQIALTGQFANENANSQDATSYSVGASYEIMDGLTADASIGILDIPGDELTSVQLGVRYAIGSRKRIDLNVIDALVQDRVNAFGPLAF